MNWLLLKNSMLVGGLTTLLAVGFGFVAALWLAGLERRWRNRVLALAVMALALPPFLVTNCWLHFLGYGGAWRSWLPLNIVSLGGTIWILSLLTWPITLLMVLSAWQRLEPSQLESDLAVSGWWLIRGLLWPLGRAGLAQAAVLTFVLATNNFAVPAILQVKVFPAEMWVRFNTTFDTLGALWLSWPLVVVPLLLLFWFARREFAWPRLEGAVQAKLFCQQLGPGWFWFCGACTILLCLVAVGLPVYQLVSVRRTWTELPGALVAGQSAVLNSFFLAAAAATGIIGFALFACTRRTGVSQRRGGWTQTSPRDSSVRSGMFIAKLQQVNQAPSGAACRPTTPDARSMPLLTELGNKIGEPRGYKHAAPDGAIARAEGCRISRLATQPALPERPSSKSKRPGIRVPDFRLLSGSGFRVSDLCRWLAWLPFLLPGVLLGIALILVFNRPWFALVYDSAGIVILAFAIRYLALGWNSLAHALQTVDRDLTDAARLEGATRWQMLRYVQWPQIAPQAAAAWYIVFLLCLWDVESMILVVPPGGETVALRVFNLLHYGHNAQVNALCLTLLALGVAPLIVWMACCVLRVACSAPAQSARRNCLLAACAFALTLTGCLPDAPSDQAPLHSRLFRSVQTIGSRGGGVGQLNKPRSVAVDAQDNLYVVDMTGRVQKFSSNGVFLLSWQMPQTDLGKPKGMCRDRKGNILVLEPHYQRVNVFSPEGKLCAQWGKRGTNAGEFTLPRAVAVDSRGEVFVSEYSVLDRVQRFTARGEKLLAGFGHSGTGPGELNRPEGLCVDAQDRVYVADSCNHRIVVYSRDGNLLRTYGKPGKGRGELSYPYDICVDAAGRQYVCEFGNSRIQVFDANDQPLEIIGGPGLAPGQFNNPWGVALDSAGNLYVADSQNHRVQKLIR
jgi:ABC-type Fe3+ transport system permease subunit/DNA-binding beta-propeller fold protein YncE